MMDLSIIGKPFRPLGRGPDAYDCLGAVLHVLRSIGIELPDPCSEGAIDDMMGLYESRLERTTRPGPLDLIAIPSENHVALILDNEYALHATRDYGVCRVRWRALKTKPGVDFYALLP